MSHVAEVRMRVLDLDALEAACEALGLVLRRGQRTYRWYGRFLNDWSDRARAAALRGHDPSTFGHCHHAIEVANDPQAYGIGVVPALDGVGYDLLYDAWKGGYGLEAVAGPGLSRLVDEYAAQVAIRALMRKGYAVQRTVDAQGRTQVVGYRR